MRVVLNSRKSTYRQGCLIFIVDDPVLEAPSQCALQSLATCPCPEGTTLSYISFTSEPWLERHLYTIEDVWRQQWWSFRQRARKSSLCQPAQSVCVLRRKNKPMWYSFSMISRTSSLVREKLFSAIPANRPRSSPQGPASESGLAPASTTQKPMSATF